jgi:hypothetical protein
MKKLLFTFLFIVASIACWGDDLYLVGDATPADWIEGDGRSNYNLTESNGVYSWTGFLKKGLFKICKGKNTWDGYHPETADLEIDATGNPQEMTSGGDYDSQDKGYDFKWKVVNPGIYVVSVNLTANTITVTPDWTDIGTADELIAFANRVNAATESDNYAGRWARLTADIDMSGKVFPGIGADDKYKRYHGTFDGQGHKISNLNMTSENCAFITVAGGGCTVKNLLIDSTCEFNGTGRVAGIISAVNYTDFGEPLTIINCGNEANVTGTGNNCAGILGCNYGNGVYVIIRNCFNSGTISSTGSESAPISGWTGKNATISNTWNIGEIANANNNNSFLRWDGTGSTYENCYTTLDWGTSVTGKTNGYASANVTSGLFAYTLNGSEDAGEDWRQTLPGDAHPYPGVFTSHGLVYANEEYECDGVTSKGTTSYSNAAGKSVHSFVNGFCSECHALDVNYKSLIGGFYELGTMLDLKWFSAMVNAGNNTINGKLTADCAQGKVEYTPIGSTTNPYTGHFDGQGHTVELALNNPSLNYQGLFGVVTDGVKIEKVVVTGFVSGNDYVGGIVGGTNGGSSNARKTDIWYCGNEAAITAAGANAGGIIGVNMLGEASIILTNCYNSGNITGTRESGALSGWLGGGWSSVRNCYNTGTVKNGDATSAAFGRNSGCFFKNCYYTASSGTDNDGENTGNGSPTEVADDDVASGVLCAKLGYGFRQNLSGEEKDDYPNFNVDHGFVNQIGAAGYSTQYNTMSDVTIPDDVEAFAGEKNGSFVTLVPVENKIKAGEPVVLKSLTPRCYNFMPTTGAAAPAKNDLQGSDGSVPFGEKIYVLANKSNGIGFYRTSGSGKYVPEGRAYLKNSSGNVKEAFLFSFDDEESETAITNVNGNENGNNAAIYNMAGQRISKLQKGINIVNGKKVLF